MSGLLLFSMVFQLFNQTNDFWSGIRFSSMYQVLAKRTDLEVLTPHYLSKFAFIPRNLNILKE